MNALRPVHGAFRRRVRNHWLCGAVLLSIALHALVVYVLVVQAAGLGWKRYRVAFASEKAGSITLRGLTCPSPVAAGVQNLYSAAPFTTLTSPAGTMEKGMAARLSDELA